MIYNVLLFFFIVSILKTCFFPNTISLVKSIFILKNIGFGIALMFGLARAATEVRRCKGWPLHRPSVLLRAIKQATPPPATCCLVTAVDHRLS